MKMRFFFVVGLLSMGAVIPCFGPAAAQAEDTVTVNAPAVFRAEAGEAFWTSERRQAAKPMPFYDSALDAPGAVTADAEAAGAPAYVRGGRYGDPPSQPVLGAKALEFADYFGTEGTKDIYTSDYVDYPTATLRYSAPWKAIGKLFFRNGTGDYSCTASVIGSRNVIVTAAHCCYDRQAKRSSNSYVFYPAYRNGPSSYGSFPWTAARVLPNWMSVGGRQNDVCVIRLGNNTAGRPVTYYTGWLGRAWNYGSVQHLFSFGYPGNIGSGLYKRECSAESYANCGTSGVNAMGCDMKHGSSGGPWIMGFKKFASTNYVNGVVSGWDACTGVEGKSFNGPRFTSANIATLCTPGASWPGCD